jgi:hypothetical protein
LEHETHPGKVNRVEIRQWDFVQQHGKAWNSPSVVEEWKTVWDVKTIQETP